MCKLLTPASPKMKLAVVVGHSSISGGAIRVTDNVREWDWNRHLAKLILNHSPNEIKIFYRTTGGGYSVEIDRVYKEVDAWGATCSVELHFNSVGDASAKGTETLTSGTTGSVKLATLMQAGMVNALGFRDRGLLRLARKDRGGRSLWQGKAPAALLEPYFGSNPVECNAVEHLKDELAEAIYLAAKKFHA